MRSTLQQRHGGRHGPAETPAQMGLFAGKVRPPESSTAGLERPRLHRLLDDGVDHGVVVVSSPPGSGKTHLVEEWAAGRQRTPREVAWVTLDRADRLPARFLRYVLAALASTATGRDALSDLSPLPPLASLDETYMTAVAEALGRLSRDVVLVLDDFEEVVGSDTEQLLRRIMRFPPEHVRIVVLTRIEPQLGQARMRLHGHLVEIGPADLALTPDEARALLAASGVTLTASALGRLHAKTQGWVAAMRIAASSLARSQEPGSTVDVLPDAYPALSDYLLTELYDDQPEDLRRFMLRGCVAEPLCAGLAEVLNRPGDGQGDHSRDARGEGQRLLSELQRANLVVEIAEPGGPWYRWQPLLAAMLRSRLRASDPALERGLHRAAAVWLRGEGRPVEAVEHAVAGRDGDMAATVLGECWLDLVLAGESAVLTDLLSLFDGHSIAADPRLAVASAFMGVRADDVEVSLALAGKALDGAATLLPTSRQRVEVMARVVQLYAATMTGEPCESDADTAARRLLERTSGPRVPVVRRDRTRRALLLYNLGAFETSRQDYDAAHAHLEAALAEADALDLSYLQLSCTAQLVEHDLHAGRLSRGTRRGREVLDAAEKRGWRSYHGWTAAHVNLASIALIRDELDAVLDHLADAERIARPVDRLNRIRIYVLRAAALCAAGRVPDASRAMVRLRELAGRPTLPAWVPAIVNTAEARYAACQGRPEEGLRWLEATAPEGAGAYATGALQTLRAELLLRCGRAAEARAVLSPSLHRVPGGPVDVSALVVDALAAAELGRRHEALDLLDEALAVSSTERLVRPFVTHGARTRPLLEALLDRGTAYEPLAVRVLEHMLPPTAQALATSGHGLSYVEPLSGREMEVLREMQGTHTNLEIAETLYVSINTLRSHMKSINRKLGASDRRDAVHRARELGIL